MAFLVILITIAQRAPSRPIERHWH